MLRARNAPKNVAGRSAPRVDSPGKPPASNGATSMSAQVAKAGSWGFAGRGVLLLANFVATPFTVRLLGPSAYGLWALIQSILIWANQAEAGMGIATTKYGSECYAHGDSDGEATIVWSAIGFVLVTTSTVALAISLGAHFLLDLLHVKGGLLDVGAWALRFSCGATVLAALGWSVNTAQQVRLRWKQFTYINTFSNLVISLGVPLAIYVFHGGVVTAAAVGLLGQALNLFGLSWDGVRVQPALLHPRIDRATLRKLVSYGGVLTLARVVGIPLVTGERFFLAHNSSTSAVAYYAVAATVATLLTVIPEQVTTPLIPALVRLESEGKTGEYRALYAKALWGVFLTITPATVLLALVAKPFLTVWAGPVYGAHGTVLLLIALVGVWASALGRLPRSYMLSAAKIKALAWLQGGELVPYLAAAWLLTARWGAVGAAIVWSARWVLDSAICFVIVRRSAGLPWVPLSQRRVRSLAAPVLLGLACLGAAMITRGLFERGGIAAVLLVVYGVGLWKGVFTSRERRGVTNLVGELLGREPPAQRRRPAHARSRRNFLPLAHLIHARDARANDDEVRDEAVGASVAAGRHDGEPSAPTRTRRQDPRFPASAATSEVQPRAPRDVYGA